MPKPILLLLCLSLALIGASAPFAGLTPTQLGGLAIFLFLFSLPSFLLLRVRAKLSREEEGELATPAGRERAHPLAGRPSASLPLIPGSSFHEPGLEGGVFAHSEVGQTRVCERAHHLGERAS